MPAITDEPKAARVTSRRATDDAAKLLRLARAVSVAQRSSPPARA